ncbi:S8 family peptidase [Microbispora bryophytorum]|uniref:Serine protease n=1 Tax=Microbispora bryophytorum TaxID=1460882 RepID=A0A8H9H3M2_9ACTN|nr:S8 family serine peptidase [Microbispora bryophytorum]MBD3138135.1 S8 family serine peptidase [Microbispora bryophytorum]TQS03902.1 S8 family serine peptidase [Microbispora bryophytorum]GGO24960.1 serine protease [Microbispora bryophytorum]
MRHRRTVHGALVLMFMAALVGVSPGIAAADPAPPSASDPALSPADPAAPDAGDAQARTLTLITGDRVTSFNGRITVQPREGVQFVRYGDGKHQYVIPTDAVPLLSADRLDRRLFDVAELFADDFDRMPELPLIVSDSSSTRGLTATSKLPAIDGFSAKVKTGDLAERWATLKKSLTSGKIWLDGQRDLSLDVSVPRTGAPVAWAQGLDGKGVKVAVLDSGIDDTHPDLAGKVVARKNFVQAEETPEEGDHDVIGHGTHVASTVAGTGAASGGKYKGVAPGATLLDGKVCYSYFGNGVCSDSAILAGMQWAVQSGAQVVNMSLGAKDTPGMDPLEQAVNDLSAQYGTLFVVAAGNVGAEQSVDSPASADEALAVGAVTKTGVVDSYSSRGPRLDDYGVKPEITAPGTAITAARSSFADVGNPGDLYVTFDGTSMATPHVSGAAAILTQAHPDWAAQQRKSALMGGARPNPDFGVFDQGAGELDIAQALKQPISATPSAVNVGFQKYPQSDDVLVRTVTYRNASDAPVTLKLAMDGSAPAGLFALSADSVTVPAGGSASVDLRTTLGAAGSTYGVFSGRIVATADGSKVQTPYSVFREQPSADLTVTTLDRSGAKAAQSITMVADYASYQAFYMTEPESTFRLPMGKYFVTTLIIGDDGTSTAVTDAALTVDKDENVVLDGRKARPLDITVPDESAAPVSVSVEAEQPGTFRSMLASISGAPESIYTSDQTSGPAPELSTVVSALFAKPDGKGGFTDSPYIYQAGWHLTGTATTGFTRHITKTDLAKVTTEYAANAPGAKGWRNNTPVVPGVSYPTGYDLPPVSPPTTRTEYFAGDVSWQSTFTEGFETGNPWPQTLTQVTKQATAYKPGSSTERWNGAVLSQPMTPALAPYPTVERRSDELVLRLGGYADAAGHVGSAEADYGGQHLTVHRDGKLVDERDDALVGIDVDPSPGRYRVDYTVSAPSLRLSTRRETVLEFTSEHNDSSVTPPLTGIGFAPSLDLGNTAKAHRAMQIPITFTQQGDAGPVRTVAVEVSYDDGATWREASVSQHHGAWRTKVKNPPGPGYVSLRGHAVDSSGNTVSMTVIRAYEVK